MTISEGKSISGILIFLLTVDILAFVAIFSFYLRDCLEVDFFDIGQGDAVFIQTPEGHQILIDGGPHSVISEKLNKVLPFWDRTIDLIILTHPEADHISGLNEVLERYEVENILWTGVKRETSEYEEWMDLIENEKANILIAVAGEKIRAGDVILHILYPFESLENNVFEDSNDTSVIAQLVFGKNSFLLAGDIHKKVEAEVLKKSTDIDSDVF